MKKTVLAALLILSLGISGCAAEAAEETAPQQPMTQLANPWSSWDTLEEAEAAAGFELGLPETVGPYNAETYRTLSSGLLEVIYTDTGSEVTVRKSREEGRDISGVHGFDRCETELRGSNTSVHFHRSADEQSTALVVTFDHGGFAWSVYAPAGFSGDSCEDFLTALIP